MTGPKSCKQCKRLQFFGEHGLRKISCSSVVRVDGCSKTTFCAIALECAIVNLGHG